MFRGDLSNPPSAAESTWAFDARGCVILTALIRFLVRDAGMAGTVVSGAGWCLSVRWAWRPEGPVAEDHDSDPGGLAPLQDLQHGCEAVDQ